MTRIIDIDSVAKDKIKEIKGNLNRTTEELEKYKVKNDDQEKTIKI